MEFVCGLDTFFSLELTFKDEIYSNPFNIVLELDFYMQSQEVVLEVEFVT